MSSPKPESTRPLFPGEDEQHRLRPEERVRVEMHREARWYERTGRKDHQAGPCIHSRFRDGRAYETKLLEPRIREETDEVIEDLEALEAELDELAGDADLV